MTLKTAGGTWLFVLAFVCIVSVGAVDEVRAADFAGPLAGVPRGQVLVVHVPRAGHVADAIDRLRDTVCREGLPNPLRQAWAELRLEQPLRPDTGITFCLGPPVRQGGTAGPWTLVTGVDVEAALGRSGADASGVVRRGDAPAAFPLGGSALAMGDPGVLKALAGRVERGVVVTPSERETLIDGDVLVRLDLPGLLRAYEPRYQQAEAKLLDRLAKARRADAPEEEVAGLEARSRAMRTLWSTARQGRCITAGLMIRPEAVDLRATLALDEGSELRGWLDGHPRLAGELDPPFPPQRFAALGYAAFDPEGLANLLQWATDRAVAGLVLTGNGDGLGPAEMTALSDLFSDFSGLLGSRLGWIVPVAGPDEPVLQVDSVVRLQGPQSGPAWRGRMPAVLDALVYVADQALAQICPDRHLPRLGSELDPAAPGAGRAVDHWHLALQWPDVEAEGEPPLWTRRFLDALVGRDGLDLWTAVEGAHGYATVAPSPGRIDPLIARIGAVRFDRAGEDERTAEALRHTLRRPNAVVVFSPSDLVQMLSRAVMQNEDDALPGSGEVPLVEPESLAVFSARLGGGDATARLYVPVDQLEPMISGYRVFRLLQKPFGDSGIAIPSRPRR